MALMLGDESLRALADDMWGTLLPYAPEPADDVAFPYLTIASHIELIGAWHGCCQVETSVDGAAAIAGAMLDLPFADVSLADLQDALGEVANILGGSVKSCVDGHTALSLPVIGQPERRIRSVDAMVRVCSTWQGHPIVVTLEDGRGAPIHDSPLPGSARAA
ncbi:MAG: chemotaxis protein CheX [Candidatus Nanopelagicales bacterium]|jgi:chemotaxis protein CheX